MSNRVIREDYNEKNLELFEKVKEGNQKAVEEMIVLNRRLAMKIANKYYRAATLEYRPSIGKEDIEQLALWGLWESIGKWNPEKGPFSTTVGWEVSRKIREIFKTGLTVSLHTPAIKNQEDGAEQIDRIPDLDAADPELSGYSSVRCDEYFKFMSEHADPDHIKQLKAYVYNIDAMPLRGEIKSALLLSNRKPIVRGFREKWLEDRINYYPTITYGGGRTSGHNDPTASAAIKTIEMEEKLEKRLRKKFSERGDSDEVI